MLAHYILDHIYLRWLVAFVLCIILAFHDTMDSLTHPWVFWALVLLCSLMLVGTIYNDYGIVLLVLALTFLLYNRRLRTAAASADKANKIF